MTEQIKTEDMIPYLSKGMTYRQVGEVFGISANAVRHKVRRYNLRKTGKLTGIRGMQEVPTVKTEESSNSEETTTEYTRDLNILTLDIETAPAIGMYFSPKTKYIPMSNMLEDGRIICWAAKWLDKPVMFGSEWDHTREGMLKSIWTLVDKADAIVSYNGNTFDMPYLNAEFHSVGLPRPRPYVSIDLFRTLRKHFRTTYYKLDFMSQKYLGDKKVDTGGMDLWRKVVIEQDIEARNLMIGYNKHDVVLTEDLYLDIRPWIDNHPPVALSDSEILCRTCGSGDGEKIGYKNAVMFRYPLYRCNNCGSMYRTTSGKQRVTSVFSA